MTKALELAKFGRETPPTGVVVGDSDTQTLSSKTFSDGPVFSSGTVNAVPYLNASKVFSTSGTFVFDGTNLGIGVASPSQKLDVYGADNQNAIISRNSGGSTSIRIQSNAAGNYLVGAGNVPVYLQSNSTTAITIDGSQNVGIGATSPADALNIGTGKKFRATHSASVYQQMFSSASGNFLNAYGDNFQINADSGAIYLTTVASQPIVFQTNGTDKLTILGTGNLGLGTAPNVWYSPTNYRVVQVGQSSFVGRITAGAEYTQILSNAYVDIYGAYKYINTGTATNFDMVNGEFRWSNKVSGTGGDSFSFDQKMTLNPSGNLGIGTISPNAKLDILGPSAAASPYLSKAIQFAPSNFPDRTWSLNYDDGGSVGNGFNISAGSTKIFYLNANGNVGIGTSSPENKLHIAGTSANNSSINTVVQNGAYKVNLAVMGSSYNYAGGYVNEGWLYTDSSNLCIGPHGNYAVKLLAGGEERMRVTSAGSVGIGTTDPQTKLHVNGTVRAAASGFQIGADKYIMQGSSYTGGLTDNDMVVVTSSQGKFVVWATDTGPVFNVKASGELVINEGGYNYDFRVESDNNENMLFVDASTNQIGIGNNTPNAPLDIRMDLGTAVTAAVRIRNTNTTARTSRLQFEDYAGIYADGLIDFKIPTAGVGASAILQMGVGGGAITMNQSGNVGIGTDNPARRLHVVGGAIKCGDNAGGARWTTDSWSRHIEIDSTNFGGGGIVWLKQDANPSRAILANNGNFYIARSTADDASAAITYDFSINSTGSVGIGTSSPNNNLEVLSSSNPSIALTSTSASLYSYFGMTSGTVGAQLYTFGQSYSAVYPAGCTALSNNTYGIILNANNASGVLKFQINGTSRASILANGSFQLEKASNETEATAQLLINGGGYAGFHWLDSTAYYIGQNSSIRSLRIYSQSYTAGVNLAAGGTSWGTFSDERLKYDIEPITNGLDKLSSIRCVSYRLKDVDASDSQKKLGVIAQDLVGVVDEVIDITKRHGDETDYMSVRYTELIPVLIKSIQEQQALIQSLKARLDAANI